MASKELDIQQSTVLYDDTCRLEKWTQCVHNSDIRY